MERILVTCPSLEIMSSVCGEAKYFKYIVLGLAFSLVLLVIMGGVYFVFPRTLVFTFLVLATLFLYRVYLKYKEYFFVMGRYFFVIYSLVSGSALLFFVPLVFLGFAGRSIIAYGLFGLIIYIPLAMFSLVVLKGYLRVYKAGRRLLYSSVVALLLISAHVFLLASVPMFSVKPMLFVLVAMFGVTAFSLSCIYFILRSGYAKMLYGLFVLLLVFDAAATPVHLYIHYVNLFKIDTVFVAISSAFLGILYYYLYRTACNLVLSTAQESL